jgi:hypothetical protein
MWSTIYHYFCVGNTIQINFNNMISYTTTKSVHPSSCITVGVGFSLNGRIILYMPVLHMRLGFTKAELMKLASHFTSSHVGHIVALLLLIVGG